jgi:putative membrane protein
MLALSRIPAFDPHPDVWLLVVLAEGAYLWSIHRRRREMRADASGDVASRKQIAWFTLGVLAIWVAVGWPLDDLADRYLFSMHMVQHMLIAFAAPPLMLLGMPAWMLRRLLAPRPVFRVMRQLTRPFIAMVLFNTGIVILHWPLMVQLSLEHEPVHFAIHVMLFATATLMWWPVISPLPEMPGLSYPMRMLYLFLQSIVPTVPASFLTFGSTPLYPFYAHAPRIWGMSVLTDQMISGLIMKIGGGFLLWTILAVIFFKWFALEQTKGFDALEWRDVERDVRSQLGAPDRRDAELTKR